MTQIGDVKRVHMIGVGGSSMSGLAGLLKDEGYEVSGSDRTRSHKTEALEARGVKVLIGHRPENVRGAQLVVYSAAIAPDNPERAEAARLVGADDLVVVQAPGRGVTGGLFDALVDGEAPVGSLVPVRVTGVAGDGTTLLTEPRG